MSETEAIAKGDSPLDLSLSAAELDARREHITDFIADQLDAAGVDRAVLGLSGGVDSSLVAHLAVEAIGAENLHGLVMPSSVNDEATMSDAERVAMELGIEYDVIEINPIVDTFLDAYPEAEGEKMAVGNVRVRARAVLNYLVANTENALVLGTGNRTESLTGYFTKYGDGAVDCHPIANLYKQQVRQLARHVGVPQEIAERTPTAGMWVDQTDEGELGVEYDTLDSILALAIEGEVGTSATARIVGVDREIVERVRDLFEQSGHKRSMPPAPAKL
ncbi:NAD+ synthetase [Halorhabdus utahensis DSM 12940]|uniref:NH(3)-dependent NAD(+) synthetase n=1 Tax=Halorhabdus utahensis (strain DSM 12940 / JCM 11049 / AX-2) TaxID=519442 RepID=C7NNC8_HALUD|nr:NAD+ synthase [Halorhabdus utahensis]ACV11528.1 NAD+ synthetase [Halorhabdus utahensis DSM 12940]